MVWQLSFIACPVSLANQYIALPHVVLDLEGNLSATGFD